jgi:hypothetical protein
MRLSTVLGIFAIVMALAGVLVVVAQPATAADSDQNQGVISTTLGI